MNNEFVGWFLILAAVGVGVVAYLAMGPVPEIADAGDGELGPPRDGTAAPEAPGPWDVAAPEAPGQGDVAADQSSPVSTTEPAPAAPPSTSDTP